MSALKKGEIIVFPTDTAYGLAGDFFKKAVLKKIYLIKNRPKNKKISLVAASLNQVKIFFYLSYEAERLARKYWPGPLTIILPLKKNRKLTGVRVPRQELARQISRHFKKPLTATSANLSGERECYDIQSVIRQFQNKKYQPDLIIDAGRLKKVKPSTLVMIENNKIRILREGPLKL